MAGSRLPALTRLETIFSSLKSIYLPSVFSRQVLNKELN